MTDTECSLPIYLSARNSSLFLIILCLLIDETAAAENNLNQEERMLIVHRLHEVLRPFVLRRVKAQVLDQV